MRRLGLACLVLAGCGGSVCDGFDGQPCLALSVSSVPPLDQLALVGESGFAVPDGDLALTPPVPISPAVTHVQVAVLPPRDFSGLFVLRVVGLLRGGAVGLFDVTGQLQPRQHVDVPVPLQPLMGEPVDLSHTNISFADLSGTNLPPTDLSQPNDLPAGVCDPVAQTGCPPGDKCTQTNGGVDQCATDGTTTTGQECVGAGGTDNCVAGDRCINSICRQFCDTNANCPTSSAANPSGCASSTGSLVCSEPCDPATQTGCPSPNGPQTCDLRYVAVQGATGFGQQYLTDCFSNKSAAGTDGATCTQNTDCANGFGCVVANPSGSRFCRKYCDRSVASSCQSPSTCQIINASSDQLMQFQFGYCCPSSGC